MGSIMDLVPVRAMRPRSGLRLRTLAILAALIASAVACGGGGGGTPGDTMLPGDLTTDVADLVPDPDGQDPDQQMLDTHDSVEPGDLPDALEQDGLDLQSEDVFDFEIGDHEVLMELETYQLHGRVVLPEGSPWSSDQLLVVNYLGQASPDVGGEFSLEAFSGDVQLAMAMDNQGAVVLAGFMDLEHSLMDAQSTAAVVAYYALGGYTLPAPMKRGYVDLLLAAPELVPVTEAVHQPLLAGQATVGANPGLTAALETLVTEALAAGDTKLMPKILYIDPGPVISGITLDTTVGINTVTVINEYRRKIWLWVERVSYVDASGVTVASPEVMYDDAGPLPSATTGIITSFVDIFQKKVAYAPKSTPSFDFGVKPEGAKSTKYRVTVVGAGYNKGDLEKATYDQKEKQGWLTYTTIFADFLIPTVINGALPLNKTEVDDFFDRQGFSSILKDLVAIGTNKAWGIAAKADKGDVKGAVQEAVKTVVLSTTFRGKVIDLVGFLGNKAGLSGAPDAAEKFGKGLGSILAQGDFLLTVFDTWVQGSDLLHSDQASIFEIEATDSKVSIEPAVTDVQMQKFQKFQAHILEGDLPAEKLTYVFDTTGQRGHIFNSEFLDYSTGFTSTLDWVWFVADVGTKGAETITVEVFLDEDGEKTSLGVAVAHIDVTDTYVGSITPFEPVIVPGGDLWFMANLEPTPEEGELSYHWTCTGNFGTLTGLDPNAVNDFWDTTGEVNFLSFSTDAGVDTIQVEIYLTKNGQKQIMDVASTTVKVQPPGSGPYKLAGDALATYNVYFEIDDDLVLKINGVTFYDAGNTEPNGHPPVELPATAGIGDVITIEIWECPCNWQLHGERWHMGDIYLVSTTQAQIVFHDIAGPYITRQETECPCFMAYTTDYTIVY